MWRDARTAGETASKMVVESVPMWAAERETHSAGWWVSALAVR